MGDVFTDTQAIELGGWPPAYARVVSIQQRDGIAIAVVDVNGDGRELEASVYAVDADHRWTEVVTGIGSGFSEEFVWESGYAPSRASVEVSYGHRTFDVPVVRATGTWYFAARRLESQPDGRPIGPLN